MRTAVKSVMVLVVLAGAWYALRWAAGYQSINDYFYCAESVGIEERLQQASSEQEAVAEVTKVIDCMESRSSYLSKIFFNREDAIASIKFK